MNDGASTPTGSVAMRAANAIGVEVHGSTTPEPTRIQKLVVFLFQQVLPLGTPRDRDRVFFDYGESL